MTDNFSYDVFLSHSSKDKSLVRSIAERLRTDDVRVWFDEWEIHPGDSIPAKIEEGLEHSRVLLLCMSINAFSSDWAQLESGIFRFRDPLNKDRRFVPLRLDETPIKGYLTQFLYIPWLPEDREREYPKLLEACRTPKKNAQADIPALPTFATDQTIQFQNDDVEIFNWSFSPDLLSALTVGSDNMVRLWHWNMAHEWTTGKVLKGHKSEVCSVAWSKDGNWAISGSRDHTIRLWDIITKRCIRVLTGHSDAVVSVSFGSHPAQILSVSDDLTVRLWNLEDGNCLRIINYEDFGAHFDWSPDRRRLLSAPDQIVSNQPNFWVWELSTAKRLQLFEGHSDEVHCAAWSGDQRYVLSGSNDSTLRQWEVKTGRCLRIFEGHTDSIESVAWSPDQCLALSGGSDGTLRLWDVKLGSCLLNLEGHKSPIGAIQWSRDQGHAISGDFSGNVRLWNISEILHPVRTTKAVALTTHPPMDQVQYTNAKVLLVGESGVGKTGLSKVLVGEKWEPTDSTVGAWASQWKLPVNIKDKVEREIWLWDFGGQADQRLIHQLYMDETALAVLVFDGQREDLLETLFQWDQDLTRSSHQPLSKLLVAGRVDTGGLRISRTQIENFKKKYGYLALIETSAKNNQGCDKLRGAILDSIQWDNIPWRSSPLLFKVLKEQIIRLKGEGRVLMRFNELRESLQFHLTAKAIIFTDEELKAVVRLLAGPGVVWELKFGSWILLQPERINAYAQAVIQTLRTDADERGCLSEERVLKGDLSYASIARLESDEERFVLLAMHQTLIERGLCLREQTDHGTVLIFPSYYRRDRAELVGDRAVLVSYRFTGFLDSIYATLVVRLHHTQPFRQDQLWRYAADFKTLTDKSLGIKLNRRAEGSGELEVYFDPRIPIEEKIIFSKYIHEHLLQNAKDVTRLRHYICPHCDTPSGNREIAMNKLAEGKKSILCVNCEKRIPLMDRLEELFTSTSAKEKVNTLQEESNVVLDNESKERALVGEVISTVALAGQICREFNVSDYGIDMEIEFKRDDGQASGKKMYLQLKSGDSYLKKRKSDGTEIFTIKDRHFHYWMAQAFPVLLVIRNSAGEISWMEVRDRLKSISHNGKTSVKQLIFEGERFDVMSVRRWRELSLQE